MPTGGRQEAGGLLDLLFVRSRIQQMKRLHVDHVVHVLD